MSGPLLETKLFIPRLRRGLVARPRLNERLDRGVESKLTLVSAPAGFGKTTLVAEWLASVPARKRPVAWLSLDQNDNEPRSFWTYLISALRTVVPGVGASALSIMERPQPAPIEAVLPALLNELSAVPNDIVLVLDDFHMVDLHDIQVGMAFLLEHLPAQLHLVITTRADPGLPLARLRARGELVELRAVDLRFTPDEAAAYLNGKMGLDLAARDVAALEGRTEGWIAALQLAALSIQGRDDIAGFIAGFAGDDRYIVDYLVEEVLERQSERVRAFLLQTSILARLNGPLCDALTGQDDGKAMLEALDRANLFLVPLDDRRQWYRYHHLFGDVLRAHLLDEQPDRGPDLHQRASEWYERNGEPAEAIRHALIAEDLPRAASLIELAVPVMRQTRQEVIVLGWLMALPSEVIKRRPVLSVHYAGTLLLNGELDGVEGRLQDAERWLDLGPERSGPATAEMVVVDEVEFRALPCQIATFRAAAALIAGDVAATMRYARLALELAPEEDPLRQGPPAGLLALAYWRDGDLESAHHWYAVCMASLLKVGYVSDSFGVALSLADIRTAQGRLREATHTYELGLERAYAQSGPILRGTADMHVGMSELLRERNDLAAARQHLSQSRELGEYSGLEQNGYRTRVVSARLAIAEGDLDGALELFDDAARQYVSDFLPNVRPVAAQKARVWMVQGKLIEAGAWARERDLAPQDDLTYVGQFEHITLARLLLARSGQDRSDASMREALELLARLLRIAEEGQWNGGVIEILVLQALGHQMRGDKPAALVPLGRALQLAEPEGYVRLFLDEGPPMTTLLEAAAGGDVAPAYARRLLAAVRHAPESKRANETLMEPLSERELDVLRLLGTDLSGPDIARELVVSLNTVRTHTKSIYGKLGVNSRRAAVSRAAELDLMRRARDR